MIIKLISDKKAQKFISLGEDGFTLVETMVTVFIFTAMMAAITMTLMAGQNAWEVNRAKISMQQSLRIAAGRIKNDLQQASESSIINVEANGVWNTTLEFRIPESVDSLGNIVWPADITKFLRGGPKGKQLIRRIAEGEAHESERVITGNLIIVKFKREAATPDIMNVYLEARVKVGTGDNISTTYETKIHLRN